MFWRMAGLSTASPVETILDKGNFTLEELLDEDEIIQECKALNARLINFLREKPQVEQFIRFIVEEAPENAEKPRAFKLPFVACEIFTCEVDIILKTLVEDKELMDLLFSFLDPKRSHSTLLAGYFSKVLSQIAIWIIFQILFILLCCMFYSFSPPLSKAYDLVMLVCQVVICLLLRKTVSLMTYIKENQEIISQLVDLIGITSIMEVLIRLIGADEHIYANYAEAMRWLEETNVLEMIVEKLSSSNGPEVHANAAETLCAFTRYAPPGIAAKVSSPSFIGRLFHNALEDSRPKSVLVNSLSICISLLDPKRVAFGTYHAYNRQFAQGSSITLNPETVEGMLGSLGHLIKLLDVSPEGNVLLTTYGKLQPPLGKQRLKIIEFISVLLSIGNEAAEKEVIRLGALKRILDLFFEYSYNNFLHHHVENIILYCLESKTCPLVEHLLRDCNLVGRILETDKNPLLSSDSRKPTVSDDGRQPPRVGCIGHLTRISNKLVNLGNTNSEVQALLQENSEWLNWCSNGLSKRNAVENVYQWACGRPTALHDRARDSDEDDYQDRDYDVAALANNLSQAFHYGIYSNDMDEGQGSLERDDEDVYFDDESAEVVISSLRLGDDQDSGSLFTNSNWFAFEDNRGSNNERLTDSLASSSPNNDEPAVTLSSGTNDDDENDTATSSQGPEVVQSASQEGPTTDIVKSNPPPLSLSAIKEADTGEQTEWVEWRETSGGSSDDSASKQEEVLNPNPKEIEKEDTSGPPEPSPSKAVVDSTDPIVENIGTPPPDLSSEMIAPIQEVSVPQPKDEKNDQVVKAVK